MKNERLTKKMWGDYFTKPQGMKPQICNEYTHKLGEIEDLEEKFGIDLLTLFKALDEGFCAKDVKIFHLSGELSENQRLDPKYIRLNMWYKCLEWTSIWNMDDNIHEYKFADYGKTWALTKEELE